MSLSLYNVSFHLQPHTLIAQNATVLAEDRDEAVDIVRAYNGKRGFYDVEVDHLTSLLGARKGTVLFCTAGKGNDE